MPLIKVISSEQAAGHGSHVAAAVMGAMSARLSEPAKILAADRKRDRAEKTRPGNPNKLTLRQHVFPSKSIGRFTNERGLVSVHDLLRDKVRLAKPRDSIFCADRAWDERAEKSMKSIEDAFQMLVGPIIAGTATEVRQDQKPVVDEMYALWLMRAQYRELETQEVQLNRITGDDLTKEQEENLEKNGYVFTRKNGMMPARQLNGIQLQMRIDNSVRSLATTVTRWGVISTQDEEFIVPDIPRHGVIPITPRLALVQSAPDGMIVEQNVAEINQAMKTTSLVYCFARDFSNCPF
ncbi:MAG: hypothetical protein ACLQU2_22790 [Candidatus Binataceae bacterium]